MSHSLKSRVLWVYLGVFALLAAPFAITTAPLVGCGGLTSTGAAKGTGGSTGTGPTGSGTGTATVGGSLTVTVSAPSQSLSALSATPKSLKSMAKASHWQGPTPEGIVTPPKRLFESANFPTVGEGVPCSCRLINEDGTLGEAIASTTSNSEGKCIMTPPETTTLGPAYAVVAGDLAGTYEVAIVTGNDVTVSPVTDAAFQDILDEIEANPDLTMPYFLAQGEQLQGHYDERLAAQDIDENDCSTIAGCRNLMGEGAAVDFGIGITTGKAKIEQEPVITDVKIEGDTFTITGVGFPEEFFEGVTDIRIKGLEVLAADITEITRDKIVGKCPEGHETAGGAIHVDKSNVVYAASGETLYPAITAVDTLVAVEGEAVTLAGANFAADTKCSLNDAEITTTYESISKVVVNLPSGAETGAIQCANGTKASNPAPIIVDNDFDDLIPVTITVLGESGSGLVADIRCANRTRFGFMDDFAFECEADDKDCSFQVGRTDSSGVFKFFAGPGRQDCDVVPVPNAGAGICPLSGVVSLNVKESSTSVTASVTLHDGVCQTLNFADSNGKALCAGLRVACMEEFSVDDATVAVEKTRNQMAMIRLTLPEGKTSVAISGAGDTAFRCFAMPAADANTKCSTAIPPQSFNLTLDSTQTEQSITVSSGSYVNLTCNCADKPSHGIYEATTFDDSQFEDFSTDTKFAFYHGRCKNGSARFAVFDGTLTGSFIPDSKCSPAPLEATVSGDTNVTVNATRGLQVTGRIVDPRDTSKGLGNVIVDAFRAFLGGETFGHGDQIRNMGFFRPPHDVTDPNGKFNLVLPKGKGAWNLMARPQFGNLAIIDTPLPTNKNFNCTGVKVNANGFLKFTATAEDCNLGDNTPLKGRVLTFTIKGVTTDAVFDAFTHASMFDVNVAAGAKEGGSGFAPPPMEGHEMKFQVASVPEGQMPAGDPSHQGMEGMPPAGPGGDQPPQSPPPEEGKRGFEDKFEGAGGGLAFVPMQESGTHDIECAAGKDCTFTMAAPPGKSITVNLFSRPDFSKGEFEPPYPPLSCKVASGTSDGTGCTFDMSSFLTCTIGLPSADIDVFAWCMPQSTGSSGTTATTGAPSFGAAEEGGGFGFKDKFLHGFSRPGSDSIVLRGTSGTYDCNFNSSLFPPKGCTMTLATSGTCPACLDKGGSAVVFANGDFNVDLSDTVGLKVTMVDKDGQAVTRPGCRVDVAESGSGMHVAGGPIGHDGSYKTRVFENETLVITCANEFFGPMMGPGMGPPGGAREEPLLCECDPVTVTTSAATNTAQVALADPSSLQTVTFDLGTLPSGFMPPPLDIYEYSSTTGLPTQFKKNVMGSGFPTAFKAQLKAEKYAVRVNAFGMDTVYLGKVFTVGNSNTTVTLAKKSRTDLFVVNGKIRNTVTISGQGDPLIVVGDADDNFSVNVCWGGYCTLEFTSGAAVTVAILNPNMTVAAQENAILNSGFNSTTTLLDTNSFNTYDPFSVAFSEGKAEMYDPGALTGPAACPPEKPDCMTEIFHGEQKTVGGSCTKLEECMPPYVCSAGVCAMNTTYAAPPPTGTGETAPTLKPAGSPCVTHSECSMAMCTSGICM